MRGTDAASGTSVIAREALVSLQVYSLDTVKKAAYRFIDRASFAFEPRDTDVLCRITFPQGTSEVKADGLVADFQRELLDQDLRQKIAAETAPLRNTILALAFEATKSSKRE